MILVRFTEKFEPRPRGLKSESRSMCTGARDPFSNSNLFENNTGSVTGANNKPGSALSGARATKNPAPHLRAQMDGRTSPASTTFGRKRLHICPNAYLLFKLHGKFGTSWPAQFMDGPHFAACHSPLPCAIASCNWDLWVSTVLYGGHATASCIPVFVCARVNKVNSIRGTEECACVYIYVCVCEWKEREEGWKSEWWKRGGVERVEEEGNGTLAPSSYFPRSASILNLSVCLCVCVYTHYVGRCNRFIVYDFFPLFPFFFLSIIVTFTSLSILIDNNWLVMEGEKLKRIINLIEICYRWIKLRAVSLLDINVGVIDIYRYILISALWRNCSDLIK